MPRTSASWSRKRARAGSSPSRSSTSVEPSMSVKTTVTVPVGRVLERTISRVTRRTASGQNTGSPRCTARIASASCLGAGVLGQVAVGARAESRDHALVDEARQDEHLRARPRLADEPRRLDPVHVRHRQVHHDHVRRARLGEPAAAAPSSPRRPRQPVLQVEEETQPLRTTSWSSAIRTRIGPAKPHLHLDRRALARRGLDPERAAERLRPLAHRGQPEPARPRDRLLGVEALGRRP